MSREPPLPAEPKLPGVGACLVLLALCYSSLLALSFWLKPSAAVHAAFWPPFAVAFLAYRVLPLRHWANVTLIIVLCDLAVIPTVVHAHTGEVRSFAYTLMLSFGNVSICSGMAVAAGFLRGRRALRRHYMLFMPLCLATVGVGAAPGVVLSALIHARSGNYALAPLDIVARLLSCMLSIAACAPVLSGLVRGFREPALPLAGRREAVGILAAFAVIGVALLWVQWPLSDRFSELVLAAMPLFWLALRFSRRAVDVGIAAATTFIAIAAAHGLGAFSDLTRAGGWADGIVAIQLYLLIACCEALLINHAMLERNALLEERERKRAQLAAYAEALDRADESARRAAAADLHDGVGQILAGQGLILGAMRRLCSEQKPLAVMLEQALAASREAQTSVRHTIQDLRPPELDGATMSDILTSMAAMFSSRYGFTVTWSVDGAADPRSLHGQLFYRVVRELIYNAYKHSQTDRVAVAVVLGSLELVAQVTDAGAGFDPLKQPAAADRFGLVGLVDRVRSAGGRLSVESRPGAGCRATVSLPLLPVRAAAERPEAVSPAGVPWPAR